MQNTPKGLRLQIGIFGRRNAGKSSLLNALARQDAAIVSDTPGTTTDPVEKAMEMLPLGPVLLIDTAGLDDDAARIGNLRIERTRKIFERADLALLVSDANWGTFEEELLASFEARKTSVIAVFNKSDLAPAPAHVLGKLDACGVSHVSLSARTGEGLGALREMILRKAPEDFLSASRMLGDLVPRLILPQVQAIRDTLDHDCYCLVVKENALADALANLKTPPALAVTDSQAFGTVSPIVPETVPLTSFSILLARQKGDLAACAAGAAAFGKLKKDSRVLIAEACSHHPVGEDIGTVKIPNWLRRRCSPDLVIEHAQGHDFPKDLSGYDLVIHCGACTFNRREVLSRILQCSEQGVPFTNYGVAIAFCFGILERALRPFPEALAAYERTVRAE